MGGKAGLGWGAGGNSDVGGITEQMCTLQVVMMLCFIFVLHAQTTPNTSVRSSEGSEVYKRQYDKRKHNGKRHQTVGATRRARWANEPPVGRGAAATSQSALSEDQVAKLPAGREFLAS